MPDEDEPRVQSHGEEMSGDMPMNGEGFVKSHCHVCWRYTDDQNATIQERYQLTQAACSVLANSTMLAVEKSDAFKAADEYLAALFKAATPLVAPRFG